MGGRTPEIFWRDNDNDVKKLEDRVRKRLGEASGATRNAFISFASDDLQDVNLLRGQAKNENSDIDFNDWSVKKPFDSEDAEYIRRGIRERIRRCSVTIVYLSGQTAASKWVAWEIEESIAMGKGVVAMYKGGSPPTLLPEAIGKHNIPVVPWNQRQLAQAVEREAGGR
ncbi:MAG: TIR domain-containing protein [Gammaproteobacteria bacterium]|nr:TIR domain-containing protein [Gammaproteobacteria bacterium]MDE2716451.1 TIR domain-containing protein [Chloroflexota bacterium]